MAKQKNIRPHLREEEELIWTGAPCEEKQFGRADRVLLPIAGVALAVSTFYAATMVASILRSGLAFRHVFELLLLLVVGGFAVYGYFLRFSVKRRAKADLVYGVTNLRRVLIRDQASRRMIEFEPSQLKDACISEVDKYGIGTIYLRPRGLGNLLDNTGLDFLGSGEGVHMALFDIPECEKVFRLIRGKRARG